MRRALFVVNPTGVRHLGELRRRCEEAARGHGWEALLMVTQAGDSSLTLHAQVRGYLEEGGERLVFAVGGDGTVRACAHDLAGTGVPLAVLPRGTANLFAHALGLPADAARALEVGFGDASRQVDLPFADGMPFVAMAGMGLDAAVVGSTPPWLKSGLGWVGYALVGAPHVFMPPRPVRLCLDGGPVLERRAHAVVVGNVGVLPGGFHLLPGALVDDGLVDVGVLSPGGLAGWARLGRRMVSGRPPRPGRHHPDLEHLRARVVELSTPEVSPRQLDGDMVEPGATMSVVVEAGALVVKAPPRAAE